MSARLTVGKIPFSAEIVLSQRFRRKIAERPGQPAPGLPGMAVGPSPQNKPAIEVQLSPAVRARINNKFESFAATGHGDVKRLKGRAGAGLRVGDWRVIFYEERGTIIVTAVGHRRDIYG